MLLFFCQTYTKKKILLLDILLRNQHIICPTSHHDELPLFDENKIIYFLWHSSDYLEHLRCISSVKQLYSTVSVCRGDWVEDTVLPFHRTQEQPIARMNLQLNIEKFEEMHSLPDEGVYVALSRGGGKDVTHIFPLCRFQRHI